MKKIISKYNKRFLFVVMLTGVMASLAIMPLQSAYSQGTVLRVYFHIARTTSGFTPAVTESYVLSEFNQLQADYAPGGICFINMGIDYVNDDYTLYYDPNLTNYYAYAKQDGINIFYIGGFMPPYLPLNHRFYSISLGGGSAICDPTGPNFTSYVMGLMLGLSDTHNYYNTLENINGSNSSTAGDYVTDTPADPWNFYATACFSTSTCCYNGTCQDPNGQTNYNPPYTNLMAMWYTKGWSPLTLTAGQYAKINSNIAGGFYSAYKPTADTTIFAGNYAGGNDVRTAVHTISTSGNVNMFANYKTTNIAGTVLLEPGFHAYPSAGGLIVFKGHTCGYITPRIASETNSAINVAKENSLKCYPNPFSGKLTIEFDLAKDDDASIKLYNMVGKEMRTISKSFFTKGKHEINIDAADVPAGIYFVVLQSSDFKKEQKMIKVN